MIRASETCWWATTVSRRSAASVAEAKESMAETSRGRSMPPTPARSMARRSRSGPVGQRRQGPGEGERELEIVRRLAVLGQLDDRVLEGQEDPRIDLEGQMQVERAAAALLGMQVDLPGLAERVRLHEVALIVDVEAVVDGMILELGHISGHIDDCHRCLSLPGTRWLRYRRPMDDQGLLGVLHDVGVGRRRCPRGSGRLGPGRHP